MGEVIKRVRGGKFLGYYVRWYEDGKRRMLASKQPTAAEARRMLVEIEARVARGEAGMQERRDSWPTLAELVQRFLVEYDRPKVKDLAKYRSCASVAFNRILPQLGALPVHRIESARVVKMRDALSRKYAPASIRTSLAFLGALFSWAMREGLAPANPCKGVEKPAVGHSLDFHTREEVRILLDELEARATTPRARLLQVCATLALHTGMRKGELLGLRWIDVDINTRRLTVARSYRATPKSGKARHLRLPTRLVPLMRTWREQCPKSAEGLVFPVGNEPPQPANDRAMLGLPRAIAEAGLRELPHPWHALRHTFASHFVMAGGNILALQRILGHSDLKMTLVYAHLAPDFLDGEMDRIEY